MKHALLTLIFAAFAGGLQAQTNTTFAVDCGNDIIVCPGDVYAFIYSEGTDTLFLGRNVKVVGGVPPYTYEWSCKQQGYDRWTFTVNDILSDITIPNPYFLRYPEDYKCTFSLKVTDAEGNVAANSLTLLREEFIYSTEGDNDYTVKSDGNRIYLTGEQNNFGSVFPMKYFAVIDSDTVALPAYITVQETDSVTIFGIDSIGCHDEPRKRLGKWLLVSIDETTADENTVKLIANTLVFNSDFEKQIRIYSISGQLLYSQKTSDSKFNIPNMPNAVHCVCNVVINNKSYSFHLIRP